MAKLAKLVSIFSLLTALVLLSSCPAISQELENQNEFSYDEDSEIGPQHWGDIKPEWSLCKYGERQSPIDLINKLVEIVSYLGPLQIRSKPSNAILKNRGHDIKLEFTENSNYLLIDGIQYALKQFHWHSPSEHTINGRRLDLELHMVHQTPSGQIAVIGVLYRIGKPDTLLSLLRKDLRAISGQTGEERVVGVINPKLVKLDRDEYYRYNGSLTTPACSQNITWTIIREVKSVSKKQIELLRVAVHDESDSNARPLQPLNDRLVQLNRPKRCQPLKFESTHDDQNMIRNLYDSE